MLQWAILQHIVQPPKFFENVAKAHFLHKKSEIEATCARWHAELLHATVLVAQPRREAMAAMVQYVYVALHNLAFPRGPPYEPPRPPPPVRVDTMEHVPGHANAATPSGDAVQPFVHIATVPSAVAAWGVSAAAAAAGAGLPNLHAASSGVAGAGAALPPAQAAAAYTSKGGSLAHAGHHASTTWQQLAAMFGAMRKACCCVWSDPPAVYAGTGPNAPIAPIPPNPSAPPDFELGAPAHSHVPPGSHTLTLVQPLGVWTPPGTPSLSHVSPLGAPAEMFYTPASDSLTPPGTQVFDSPIAPGTQVFDSPLQSPEQFSMTPYLTPSALPSPDPTHSMPALDAIS